MYCNKSDIKCMSSGDAIASAEMFKAITITTKVEIIKRLEPGEEMVNIVFIQSHRAITDLTVIPAIYYVVL